MKRYAVEWMKTKTKSLQFTKQFLQDLENSIMEEIEKLGGHKQLTQLMVMLSKDVRECECD